MISEEQREIRRSGIGGSDMAAILGIHPKSQAYDVWLEKTLRAKEKEESEPAYWGNVHEDAIARRFAEKNSVTVRRDNETKRHKNCPVMIGHIDRRIVGVRIGLECKSINAFSGLKLSEPLEHHVIQCQHYMEVLDWDLWYIAYLVGGNQYRQWEIDRDREIGAMLRAAAEAFWRDYVETDTPPPLDPEHGSTSRILAELYPGTDGTTVHLPDELAHWAEVRAQAKEDIARLETVCTVAENRIKDAMGTAAIGTIAGWEFKRKEVKRAGYTVPDTRYMTLNSKRKGNIE